MILKFLSPYQEVVEDQSLTRTHPHGVVRYLKYEYDYILTIID